MNTVEIGQKLRQLRGTRTIAKVAEATGISVSALNMYELGQRMPRDDVKVKLANYFGLSVSALFYPDDITNRDD